MCELYRCNELLLNHRFIRYSIDVIADIFARKIIDRRYKFDYTKLVVRPFEKNILIQSIHRLT